MGESKRYDCCNEAAGFEHADDCPAIAEVRRAEAEFRADLEADADECEGHPAGPFDPMGVTVYCDGSCRRIAVRAATGGES